MARQSKRVRAAREKVDRNVLHPVDDALSLVKSLSSARFAESVDVSVNLGVLNLLPFPILDGGHLLFLLVEKIKGSPVSFGIQELVTKIAFVLIISLALFVTFHDVVRLFS